MEPKSGLNGVKPPVEFGERTRDCSLGHTLFKTQMWACGGHSYSLSLSLFFFLLLMLRNSRQETGKQGSDDRILSLRFDLSCNTAIGWSCAIIASSLLGEERVS